MALIVGTGRAGTHLVGEILRARPDVRITIEEPPMFEWATRMALNPGTRERLLPRLVDRYAELARDSAPRIYADKSHPALWIAGDLARELPGALFVGVSRGPRATVASMLRHDGVLAWQRRWREFPVPNEFLGISAELAPRYEHLSPAARCALRWRAHEDRLRRLEARLGDRFLRIRYERLVSEPVAESGRLAAFLDLPPGAGLPPIRTDSLERWREELDEATLAEIDRYADDDPDAR